MVNGVIVIEPSEAEIVRKIYADRLSGIGVYAIGKGLYEQRVPYFSTERDKAIKKASAILYKDVYCGNKGYPAIVSRSDFDRAAAMKSEPLRKSSQLQEKDVYTPITTLKTSYAPTAEITAHAERIEAELETLTQDSTAIREMILKLATMKYECIRTEE
jgi:hypothetical protein